MKVPSCKITYKSLSLSLSLSEWDKGSQVTVRLIGMGSGIMDQHSSRQHMFLHKKWHVLAMQLLPTHSDGQATPHMQRESYVTSLTCVTHHSAWGNTECIAIIAGIPTSILVDSMTKPGSKNTTKINTCWSITYMKTYYVDPKGASKHTHTHPFSLLALHLCSKQTTLLQYLWTKWDEFWVQVGTLSLSLSLSLCLSLCLSLSLSLSLSPSLCLSLNSIYSHRRNWLWLNQA